LSALLAHHKRNGPLQTRRADPSYAKGAGATSDDADHARCRVQLLGDFGHLGQL